MLTIGKAAARANVTPDTLRYYEREGLIRPATKSEAGYRLYDTEQVRRLQFIRQAQDHASHVARTRRPHRRLRERDAPGRGLSDPGRLRQTDVAGVTRPPVKLELFYAAGCASCDAARDALKAAASQEATNLVWRDVNVLDELDYAVELGVLTLPAIAIDGELAFSSLPLPSELRSAIARRRTRRG